MFQSIYHNSFSPPLQWTVDLRYKKQDYLSLVTKSVCSSLKVAQKGLFLGVPNSVMQIVNIWC